MKKEFKVTKQGNRYYVDGFSGANYKSGSRSACYRWLHSLEAESAREVEREAIKYFEMEKSGEIDRHNEAVLKEYYEGN